MRFVIPFIFFLTFILVGTYARDFTNRRAALHVALCATDSECAELFGGNGDPDDPPLVPSVRNAECAVWVIAPNDALPAPAQWAIKRDCEAA